MPSAFYIPSTSQMVLNRRCELGWLSQCLGLQNCNAQIQVTVGLLGLLGKTRYRH